jgi:ferrous iron transport protein A
MIPAQADDTSPRHSRSSHPLVASTSGPEAVPLTDLQVGEHGRIDHFTSAALEVAFLKLGIVKGNAFVLSDIAPLGDPIALSINGTKVALRKKDAGNIWIMRP